MRRLAATAKRKVWAHLTLMASRILKLVFQLTFDMDNFELYFRLCKEQSDCLMSRVGLASAKYGGISGIPFL